jgi:arabinogalactan oligomer/maltooligosaccharide transport system substrate-binding protein
MKNRLTLILIALMLVGTFASVSAQDETPTLLIWADETRAAVIEQLGAGFEEEYGVILEVQQVGFGDIRDQMRIAAPAGEGPDIIIGAHDWLGELVINGLVAPVDLGDAVDLFSPVAIQAFSYDGQLYGVPYAVENVAMFYNTELVDEVPATWDGVRTLSQEIMDSGTADYGFIRQEGDPYHFYPIQTAFGGYVFGLNEDGSYNPEDVGIDDEGSIAALTWVQDMVRDGLIPSGLDGNAAQTLFMDGDAAMYITGPWNIENFVTAGTPFAVGPIPAAEEGGTPGAPFIGAQGFMVSAFSENPLLAQVFLTEFVASEEVQQALYEQGGRPAALLSVMEAIDDPYLAGMADAGQYGLPMPAIPEMSAVWTAWGDAVTLAMQDVGASPADLFSAAAETVRAAIAGEE